MCSRVLTCDISLQVSWRLFQGVDRMEIHEDHRIPSSPYPYPKFPSITTSNWARAEAVESTSTWVSMDQVRKCPQGYYCKKGQPPKACGKGSLCSTTGLSRPRLGKGSEIGEVGAKTLKSSSDCSVCLICSLAWVHLSECFSFLRPR